MQESSLSDWQNSGIMSESQGEKGLEATGWSKMFILEKTTQVGGDAYWAADIKIWRNKAAEVELRVNCTEVKGKNGEVEEITDREES